MKTFNYGLKYKHPDGTFTCAYLNYATRTYSTHPIYQNGKVCGKFRKLGDVKNLIEDAIKLGFKEEII